MKGWTLEATIKEEEEERRSSAEGEGRGSRWTVSGPAPVPVASSRHRCGLRHSAARSYPRFPCGKAPDGSARSLAGPGRGFRRAGAPHRRNPIPLARMPQG